MLKHRLAQFIIACLIVALITPHIALASTLPLYTPSATEDYYIIDAPGAAECECFVLFVVIFFFDLCTENTNPIGINGMYYDTHRSEYMTPNRIYNPRRGRWNSPDPFFHALHGNLQSCVIQSGNLFMFVMHNPVRFTDPTGLWSKDIHEELTRLALEIMGADSGLADLFASFADSIVAGNLYIDIEHAAASLGRGFGVRQSKHFNRNSANQIDSRIEWAEYFLTAAINMWLMADMLMSENWFTFQDRHNMQMDALHLLGRGLHSIQDMEAHGDIGMGWRGAMFAVHIDPRTDRRGYDWNGNSRRWVTSSTEELRFNTSLNDSIHFLDRFFTAIGLN